MNQLSNVAKSEGRHAKLFGLKSLKCYMNPNDIEPSVAQMELFFNNTMRKIRNQCKDPLDIEKDREKWKDIFEELIEFFFLTAIVNNRGRTLFF
uniref:GLOBIN domain-containing protein n=1 Tax=Strongyloides stercoralis TaxID=6248 RepID=A0A0K0DTT2_STRER